MRIIGKRRLADIGMRGPTQAEIDASVEASRCAPRVVPKGVYRFRSQAEANAADEKWAVEAMVAAARRIDRSSS